MVKVKIKTKLKVGYKPGWSDKLYTISAAIPRNAAKLVSKKQPAPLWDDVCS